MYPADWIVVLIFAVAYLSLRSRIIRPPPPPPPPRPSSLAHSPLGKLPFELIVGIAKFLPPSAAAAFTVTCWSVWYVVGSRYLEQLRSKGFEASRFTFLKLIERELPYYVACADCRLLHRGDRGGQPHRRRCTVAAREKNVDRYVNPNFNSATFQLAIKLYRFGASWLHCKELLDYSDISFETDYTHGRESVGQFIGNHYVVRNQDYIRLCHRAYCQGCLYCKNRASLMSSVLLSLVVCPHLQHPHSNKPATATRFGTIVGCRASHYNNQQLNATCSTCTGLHQCPMCPTEFQLDTSFHKFLSNVVILTRWLDLGEGQAPEDPMWKSHIGSGQKTPIPFKAGSIKAAYQHGHPEREHFAMHEPEGFFFPQQELIWVSFHFVAWGVIIWVTMWLYDIPFDSLF